MPTIYFSCMQLLSVFVLRSISCVCSVKYLHCQGYVVMLEDIEGWDYNWYRPEKLQFQGPVGTAGQEQAPFTLVYMIALHQSSCSMIGPHLWKWLEERIPEQLSEISVSWIYCSTNRTSADQGRWHLKCVSVSCACIQHVWAWVCAVKVNSEIYDLFMCCRAIVNCPTIVAWRKSKLL